MRIARSFSCIALCAAATLSAAVVTPAASAEVSGGVTIPSFYDPPSALPSGNGVLIRSQRLFTGLNVYGNATRIMYTSTDANGAQVAVTGSYIEPWTAWTGPGPRPLVSFASGTIGQGDQCAPSMMLQSAVSVSFSSFGINYELSNVNALLSKGIAVVFTDYVGLGATDRVHTYMNRVDQAHAVLDAARVAPSVPGASVTRDSRVGSYGYSQGGGASAAAAELQPSYAPDVPLVGAYAGAPPANLRATLDGIDASAISGVAGYFVNGVVAENPQLAPVVSGYLNATGQAELARVSTQCIGDTMLTDGYRSTTTITKSGQSLGAIVDGDPRLSAVVAAQRIGRLKPAAPVRVATGVYDDIVPHAQAKQLAADWCSLGANVTYVPIPGVNLGNKTGSNHVVPYGTDSSAAQSWMLSMLRGGSATSNCSSLATLP